MAATLFDHFKRLYDGELYKSAIELGEILLKSNVRNKSLLNHNESFQTLAIIGHCHYAEQEYQHAEAVFRQALAARRRLIAPPESSSSTDHHHQQSLLFAETELKFKTAQCLAKLNDRREAIRVLESIPLKQRPAKVHHLHARLSIRESSTTTTTGNNNNSSAIFSLTEVLKEHQLALDVAESLLELGVTGLEVNSLMVDATHLRHCEWLSNWIEAHALIYAGEFRGALVLLHQLESESPVQNHHRLLVQIGKCHFYDGADEQALRYLTAARTESPHHVGEGLVLLALLLCRVDRLAEVEALTATVDAHAFRPEHWFVLGLHLYFSQRHEHQHQQQQQRLDLILERARGHSTFLDVEVALLRANVLIACQRLDAALQELRSVMKVAAHRFELYKALANVHVRRGKFSHGEFFATKAAEVLGTTPRTLMLLAKTHERDPAMQAQLKPLLLRIHRMDENYLPAIHMLVDVLLKEKDYAEALRILRRQCATRPNARIATKIGDICTATQDHLAAIDYYNMAVRLDPSCQKAVNALNNMNVVAGVPGKRGAGISETTTTSRTMEAGGGGDMPFEESSSSLALAAAQQNDSSSALWSDGDGDMHNM